MLFPIHIFFHTNFLKFTREDGTKIRDFPTIYDFHELVVKNWNSVVRPQDKIYLLGDMTGGSIKDGSAFTELMFRLNGHKRLIPGNHDDPKDSTLLYPFEKVYGVWRIFKEHNFVFSHVPIHPGSFRFVQYNVHGHTHENDVTMVDPRSKKEVPDPRYINISCEKTNFTPISFEEIKARMKPL